MKKKGFTLIELIVVIAIIGVLAAILVPAMLGYVKKSKITTANTTAKSIFNALNTSLVDMDSDGLALPSGTGQTGISGDNIGDSSLKARVLTYFSDVKKVKEWSYQLTDGQCTAVAAMNGTYPGSYPKQMTVEVYNSGVKNLTQAFSFAKT